MDKIVQQSSYFAKVCDREVNKKAHRGQLIFIAILFTSTIFYTNLSLGSGKTIHAIQHY